MSKQKRKRQKPTVHKDALEKSEPDIIHMVAALHDRFSDLVGAYRRIKGKPMEVPAELRADIDRWRDVLQRFSLGDLRTTNAEWESIKSIGRWCLMKNAKMRNQPVPKINF